LIRQALEDGASELGLAKRLADNTSDTDPEVKRWRYVVRRARAGGEPSRENVKRIAETFGADPAHLDQRSGALPRPWRQEVDRRLEAAEATERNHTVAIGALLETVYLLHAQVRALGGEVPDLPAPIAEHRPGVEGTGA
jgi:hypothetical protein